MNILKTIKTIALQHDDLPAFHASYIVLTFLFAALLNIGAFAVLVGLHMLLDVFKYREVHGLSWESTIHATLRESLTDAMLLMIGVVFAVYLHYSAGIIAVSGLLRSEGYILRAVGMFIPKLKVLCHTTGITASLRTHVASVQPWMRPEFARWEQVCCIIMIVTAALLAFAPGVLESSPEQITSILARELNPLNF
ncbi:MAG: hypothetical protein Q7R81_00150 [Candidatus Peregrinibacteria bacterium]|nr:hypothetical protein [Candidatus Peregrinibacteria bacterium]